MFTMPTIIPCDKNSEELSAAEGGDQGMERRHGTRERQANTALDQEAVIREKVVRLHRSRGGHASNVTKKYNEFMRAVEENLSLSTIKSFQRDLYEAFCKFEVSHVEYLETLHEYEPEKVAENEAYYHQMEMQFKASRIVFESLPPSKLEHTSNFLQDEITPSDSTSQHGSCVSSRSTASARARAAARKAGLEAKMACMAKQNELVRKRLDLELKQKQLDIQLERERQEADIELKQLELEGEIKAADAEEITLAKFVNPGSSSFIRSPDHHDINIVMPKKKEDKYQHSTLNPFVQEWPRHNAMNASHDVFVTPGQVERNVEELIEEQSLYKWAKDSRSTGRMGAVDESHVQCSENRGVHVEGMTSGLVESEMHPLTMSMVESQMRIQSKLLDVVSLPKMSLTKFDGEPLDYSTFMNAFDSCVGGTMVDDGAKLNRLLEYTTGRAAKVLKPCGLMKPNLGYAKARQLLKDRFGNDYMISEAWVNKVADGTPIKHSPEAVQDLADDVRGCIEVLKAMGKLSEIDSRGRMLKILNRLPLFIQGRWRKAAVASLDRHGGYPNIEEFAIFLERVAREMNDPVFGVVEYKPNKPRPRDKGSSFQVQVSKTSGGRPASSNSSGKPTKPPDDKKSTKTSDDQKSKANQPPGKCYLCNGDHSLRTCSQFTSMSVQKRMDLVKEKRLCFNCLETRNHSARWCGKRSDCDTDGCRYKHSKLLHGAVLAPATDVTNGASDTRVGAQSMACGYSSGGMKIALPIVSVWVRSPGQAKYIQTHALLDPGSNRTFCSLALAEKLGLEGRETTLALETLNAGRDAQAVEIALEVTGTVGKRSKRTVVQLPKVFAVRNFPALKNSQVHPDEVKDWKHLRDVKVTRHEDSGVSFLIGQDVPKALIPLEVRYGGENDPYATRTVLGWTLNGPLGESEAGNEATCNLVVADDATDASLQSQVELFWTLDTSQAVDGTLPHMSAEDKDVVDLWDKSTILQDGHYVLSIPFKSKFPNLPDNRMMAEKRLQSLGRRLLRNPKLYIQYKAEVESLVEKGYAEKVDETLDDTRMRWYIPHHNVVNPNKPEKFRIVYDCAAKYAGTSLNKEVSQGPDLTNKLLGVLLRFRENEIAMMGDIESMYHQVRVMSDDRDVLRFLWWRDGNIAEEPEVYRMTVHLFGGVWSPSCAAYALRRTAEDNIDEFPPDVVNAVFDNFYVDDCLVSVAEKDAAIRLQSQLCQLLQKGGFRLTKWISNNRDVLQAVPGEERATQLKSSNLELGASLPVERALGVQWDAELDVLGLKTKVKDPVCTKRGVLATMSSVYDPLGLVGPYVLLAKKLFQDECRLNKGWDESLEARNEDLWKKWMMDLAKLQDFKVDRCLVPERCCGPVAIELHHFCDASQDAYGAVSYLRIVYSDGEIHCSFVLAKTRLAPIKQTTIPRLELLAAVVAVQLEVVLRRELRISIDRSIFWSDSMIVLQYVKNRTKRFQTFVANRVARIQEVSNPDQWRHVDTKSNPADHASRGLDAQQMVLCEAWRKGPNFLWKPETSWPKIPETTQDLLKNDKEVKRESKSFVASVAEENDSLETFMSRYSSWYRLRKAVGWLLRYKDWLLEGRPTQFASKQLDVSDMQRAEKAIVIYVQQVFAKDVHHKEVSTKSVLYPLEPTVDEDGILRVGGRLRNAPVDAKAKHPAILPRDSHATMLIVRDAHEWKSRHSGREHVLSIIRQQYWIPRGRTLINKVLKQCVVCRRWRGKPCGQRMADLPVERVSPGEPPFTYVGVDCFGPFFVKRGRSREKRYGCLFTCLTLRAVHLEKLHSMDADAFLNAFIRFTARRGTPKKVRSDNGGNFVAAAKIKEAFLLRQIEWEFNPPVASHMGGSWERQIRTVRKVINVLLMEQVLDDERLDTVFCEVESIVNGRPLTPVSGDPKDPEELTPNHLLLMRDGPAPILRAGTKKEDAYGRRWRHTQLIANEFWKRWLKEYLSCLRLRQKWLNPQRNLSVDDVVLVSDESTPRGEWPMGRETKTHVASDGFVRSVELKMKSGHLVRPVHKLHLLEAAK